MRLLLAVVACVMITVPAMAQPTVLDPNLAWTNTHAADVASWVTAAAAIGLDTWQTWQAPNKQRAFGKQLMREGAIIGSAELTKWLVHRTRPDGSDNKSFFSEHTALAFSAMCGARLQAVVPLSGATGYLRLGANKHFLTDVVVGGLVGGAIGCLMR